MDVPAGETASMKFLKIAAAVVAMTLSSASWIGSANAATASNSQAGANGHNSNMEKPIGKHRPMRRHRTM